MWTLTFTEYQTSIIKMYNFMSYKYIKFLICVHYDWIIWV